MKKISIIITLLMVSIFLISCNQEMFPTIIDTTDYTEEIESLALEIEQLIPNTINANFDLPTYDQYDIVYTLGDQSFTDEYVYNSPFFDIDQEFKYQITRGQASLQFSKDVRHLSYESGQNFTKMYIDLTIPIGHISKDHYTPADVTVRTTKNGEEVVEHSTTEAQLRGRGNSTWYSFDKKPYRLRFDKNTSILGMPEAKSYVLLTEYSDKSLMRNAITHKMSTFFQNIPYHLQIRYVELYVNQEYRGLYVLTEQVQVHPNKYFIESVPGSFNTGYFLEMDWRLMDSGTQPGFDWFRVSGIPYEINEPDANDPAYTTAHVTYISQYIADVENALIAKSGYEALIDVDNFVEHFLIHEFVKNVDVGWSSVFMAKERDEKLLYPMIWDFDLAIGNADYIDYGPENFYGFASNKNRLFHLMMQVPEIRLRFRDRFNDFYFDELPILLEMIPVLSASLNTQVQANFTKWNILNHYVWPNPPEMLVENTHDGQVQYVIGFLNARAAWMLEAMLTEDYENGVF
ncbi:CotH kinase family protein [Peloplasma aerotolerans]|uniref:CotH kinase family protein n=1 Tax=Peloplasma aerotolerans TaxID=3044389 RepID=A0AAW6U854_9MOLU|nr:CotH kinase family protein [Mariniplasma sp. M4Ah]MDI6452652.1 CotH kinase family protein [Mariniplasma sp. M4Ah]